MDAEQARAHVEQYKSIAQAHEHALAELNATYDEYRRSMEAGTAQRDVRAPPIQVLLKRTYADASYRRRYLLFRSVCNP